MNSLFPLRYRRVLWGAAILACLVSGFVVLLTKIPVQVPKSGPGGVAQGSPFSPAAFPTGLAAQPRLVEAVSPNPGSRARAPATGRALSRDWSNPTAGCGSASRLIKDRRTRR